MCVSVCVNGIHFIILERKNVCDAQLKTVHTEFMEAFRLTRS